MNNVNERSSVSAIGFADPFNETVVQAIQDTSGCESLGKMTIIANETSLDGHFLQNCHGVSLALDILRKDPSARVTLLGYLPLAMIRLKKPEIDVLLRNQNFRLLDLPTSPATIIEAWQQATEDAQDADPEALAKYAMQQIRIIVHGIKVADPKNPTDQREAEMVARGISEAKAKFPSLEGRPDDEIIDFIYDSLKNREEVRKGESLAGVYCDVEGTILVNGNVNQEVVEQLSQYEADGKQVTLWTDGDTEQLKALLQSKGVSYPVCRKADFAGAQVEIAIDDMDELAFTARTKIQALTFIRIE